MSRPWAHPRSRRENMMRRRVPANGPGSSPLTPGKRQQLARRLEDQGLIPAHAGKTLRPWWRRGSRGDHPRSRGENHGPPSWTPGTPGSSPLTRGKHESLGLGLDRDGIIPAHAGKTPVSGLTYPATWDHPRSRGENSRVSRPRPPLTGSSPLTRGKPVDLLLRGALQGIIPAHAGKTSSVQAAAPPMRDHPRSRGENRYDPHAPFPVRGSSPLTRGKRRSGEPFRRGRGIIPAHAGKTVLRVLRRS